MRKLNEEKKAIAVSMATGLRCYKTRADRLTALDQLPVAKSDGKCLRVLASYLYDWQDGDTSWIAAATKTQIIDRLLYFCDEADNKGWPLKTDATVTTPTVDIDAAKTQGAGARYDAITAKKVDPNDCWSYAEIAAEHARQVVLWGEYTGTGKTYTGNTISKRLGLSLTEITMTEQKSAADLLGHWIPQADGSFAWHYGPLAVPFRDGGLVVIDELLKAADDALDVLLSILNDKASACVTLGSGEVIRRHDDFRCIATMNDDYEDMTRALKDRFAVNVHIDQTHPGAIATLPADLQPAAVGTCCHEDPEQRITFRQWKQFGKLREVAGENVAAISVFGKHKWQDVLDSLKVART